MAWEAIPGFSEDIEVFYADLAKTLPVAARVVEVGVLFGRSVACLGTLRPDIDLWAVDCWEDGDRGEHEAYCRRYGSTWAAFLGGMREHAPEVLERLHVVRSRSTHVHLDRSADVVFLDAGHEYEDVRADIWHWALRVRPGGVLAGHDYLLPNHPGVVRAVDEVFGGRFTMGPGLWTSVWKVTR